MIGKNVIYILIEDFPYTFKVFLIVRSTLYILT
jgi:hypothetical protein